MRLLFRTALPGLCASLCCAGLLGLSSGSAAQATANQAEAKQAVPFTVEVRFVGKVPSAAQQATVRAAAARVSKLIASPFVPVTLPGDAEACDKGLPAVRGRVDHFFVFVRVLPLDEDLYAEAWPCDLHDGSYLPVYGAVSLNARGLGDLSAADLTDTMIHETLHALGVGTLWEADARVSLSGASDERSLVTRSAGRFYYTGARGVAAYRALGGRGDRIPLDADAGHWAGSTVCSEILSGDAGDYTGRVNPVSPITLGALEDLGYRVNRAAASPYTLPLHGCGVQSAPAPAKATPPDRRPVSYASCAAVRAAGAAPLRRGDPGYRAELDGDGDGLACE
ncbi:excalibur calcium-binding domain-containing protein [uncultured Deinococcus sp.]|uniref:excalibur calcium-binding domain-containing protein n=1 Tax=uncultured Deinococcus sp. TaxID=158789 RepID=UPI00258E4955|nr:excalibur calcium-binding domain-containing protein [uncultured Deinococcus sp.]